MFTGIVEAIGEIVNVEKRNSNCIFTVQSPFKKIKVDQSISHNGVCLTVTGIKKNTYTVTAIKETLDKTNLSFWKKGDKVNLERSLKLGDRLDGHLVQGHVDTLAVCEKVKDQKGSTVFTFQLLNATKAFRNLLVEKGSVAVNGVSLTIVSCNKNSFSVAIIPYTFNHTNFSEIKKGSKVNIEFDILGKYILKMKK